MIGSGPLLSPLLRGLFRTGLARPVRLQSARHASSEFGIVAGPLVLGTPSRGLVMTERFVVRVRSPRPLDDLSRHIKRCDGSAGQTAPSELDGWHVPSACPAHPYSCATCRYPSGGEPNSVTGNIGRIDNSSCGGRLPLHESEYYDTACVGLAAGSACVAKSLPNWNWRLPGRSSMISM